MQTKELTSRSRAVPSARAPSPLYQRLPRGPHGLDPGEVARHQRARIHGAMIEAVACEGLQGTSVKRVIALAGVSRRSFYEHFANREDCFLATFDMLAGRALRRARRAFLETDGDLEERLRGAFAELASAIAEDSKGADLVLLEAQRSGAAAGGRLRAAITAGGAPLGRALRGLAPGVELPLPLLRAIAGGLHGILSANRRQVEEGAGGCDLPAAMLDWTLTFRQAPAGLIAAHARLWSPGGGSGAARRARVTRSWPRLDEAGRMRRAALRLALEETYDQVTPAQIADESLVPAEAFEAHFADRDDCFMAAMEALAGELVATVGSAQGTGLTWPEEVRVAMGALTEHLGARPLDAATIAEGAFAAGPRAARRNLELAVEIAGELTRGAPGRPAEAATVDAIAGAIWHTVGCLWATGRPRLLPFLSDYLAYVVLAPYLGGAEADGALAGAPPSGG